ncbi:MAG: hypothetical protein ACJ8AW_35000, partial [Rhodopila sp.]
SCLRAISLSRTLPMESPVVSIASSAMPFPRYRLPSDKLMASRQLIRIRTMCRAAGPAGRVEQAPMGFAILTQAGA